MFDKTALFKRFYCNFKKMVFNYGQNAPNNGEKIRKSFMFVIALQSKSPMVGEN